jgi:protein gp37
MSDNTPIEWAEATWNPVTGCDQIPGKDGRPSGNRTGRVLDGRTWSEFPAKQVVPA